MKYHVESNYGGAIFTNEEDAITALWMLGSYHEIQIDRKTVKKALDYDGYFEVSLLSIVAI